MSAKKKTYSADFKAKVVLELLSEGSTLNQIASKYEITQQSLLSWKKQFLENASQAFDSSKMSSEYKKEIEELEKQNDRLAKSVVVSHEKILERLAALQAPQAKSVNAKKNSVDSQNSLFNSEE